VKSKPEEFLEAIVKSNLMSAGQMARLREQLSAHGAVEPFVLAQLLVRADVLTPWQADELLAGRTEFFLGRYKLLKLLGAGGTGTVYKAQHVSWNKIVAVKVMARELLQKPEALHRFQREARLAAALDHPNIVKALDAESVGNTHFLVLEFVEGQDLDHWLRKSGPLPIGWVCECLRQTALGLQHAHERGLVHRDIKPGNLLVNAVDVHSEPFVKILDMGFARLTTETHESARLTRPDQTFGTPDFIAPEQAESTRQADIRSDIFSLGCTAFKALTGELPYPGVTKIQKIMARANREALSVRQFRPAIPEGLAAVLARMMSRLPDDRFQVPGEVVAALTPYANWRGESAGPVPVPTEPAPSAVPSAAAGAAGALAQAGPPRFDNRLALGPSQDAKAAGAPTLAPSAPLEESQINESSVLDHAEIPADPEGISIEIIRRQTRREDAAEQAHAARLHRSEILNREILSGLWRGGLFGALIGAAAAAPAAWACREFASQVMLWPHVLMDGMLAGAVLGGCQQAIRRATLYLWQEVDGPSDTSL